MAEEWQSAWVEVLPDFSDFRNRANPQITSILGSAGTAGGRAATSSMGAVFAGSFFGTVLASVGTRIVSAITNSVREGVAAGIDFIGASISEASDLNESVNALNVSFGDASEGIQALGRDAATSLALSNVEFNALAVRFSAFARQIVGDGGDVTGVIDELTTRGADFASVYNIQVAEALTLFQSGLAGETEPLRRYGIDLSAATVAAYAYANGIAEQGKQLTAQQKVQAAYGTLMEQTSQVQGDFANTSDELANQQRILAARFADAQAELGTALLPAMTDLVNLANDKLVPVLNDVIDEVGPILADAIAESVPAIGDLVEALAPLIPDLVKLAVEVLPVLVDLLIVLAPLMIDWAANTSSLWGALNDLLGLLKGDTSVQEFSDNVMAAEGSQFDFLNAVMETVGGAIGWYQRLQDAVEVAINAAIETVRSFPVRVVGFLSDVGSLLVGSGRSLIQGFIDGINQMLRPVRNAVDGVMSLVSGFFPKSPAKYGPFSGAGWDAVQRSGRALFDQFDSGFGGELGGGVSIPDLSTSNARLAGSAVGGVRGDSTVTLNLTGIDPATVYQMLRQDLGGRLAAL